MVFKSCASQIIHYICGLRSKHPRGEEVLTAELSGTHLILHLQIDLLEYTLGVGGQRVSAVQQVQMGATTTNHQVVAGTHPKTDKKTHLFTLQARLQRAHGEC